MEKEFVAVVLGQGAKQRRWQWNEPLLKLINCGLGVLAVLFSDEGKARMPLLSNKKIMVSSTGQRNVI